MNEEMKNAGYTIIERFPVGEQGFALGHSETAPAPYVTWQYRTADPDNFFWGHYFADADAAYRDYAARVNEEVEYTEISHRAHLPNDALLPQMCFSTLPSTGELILIKRGERGYLPCHDFSQADEKANRMFANDRNRCSGVSKAQEAAMLHGSLFGWHTKAADPRSYDENGQPVRTKKRDEPER